MSVDVHVKDGRGTPAFAKVTTRGQLITSPLDFSIASSVKLEEDDTAYNLVAPVEGQQIVITDILLYANKNVGVGDATVDVYEAVADDTTDVLTVIVQTEMLKQTNRDFTGLNLITSEGSFINAKTDDDDVFVTIMCYYVDANG